MPTITFDLTGLGEDTSELQLVQDGVTLSLEGANFEAAAGGALLYNVSGEGVFNVVEDQADVTRNGVGLGVSTDGFDRETSIGGDNPDELIRFLFDQEVTVVSVDLVPEGNFYNGNTSNQKYRLFTDADNDGALDTISANTDQNGGDDIAVGVTGSVIGIGAERHSDSFRIASITIDVPESGGNTGPDAITVAADAGPVSLDVLNNDFSVTTITAVDLDADDDGADDIQGTVSVAEDGLSVVYDPGTAFAELPLGETATETFTYDVTGSDGETRTETVTVTVEGQYVAPTREVTFDLTGAGADASSLLFQQDGVSLTVLGAHFEAAAGGALRYNVSGEGVFNVVSDTVDVSRDAAGLGAQTLAGDGETSIGGDDPDELLQFAFDQNVEIISVEIVPEVNRFSGRDDNQKYRLFTDTNNDGALDTISANTDIGDGNVAMGTMDDFFAIGAERHSDSFRIASITVRVPEATEPTARADSYELSADAEATDLNLLDNDVLVSSILSVDDAGLSGIVTVAADGQSVSYDPGTAFDTLPLGETAVETFTYTAEAENGVQVTQTATVTVEGTFVQPTRTVTFDLTGLGDNADVLDLVQDGVTLSMLAANFEGTDGAALLYNVSGADVFNVVTGDAEITRDAAGLGAFSQGLERETSIGGDNPDEMIRFAFDQEVTVLSVDLVPEGNVFNSRTDNQKFRLFTDSDNDGALDTVSANTDQNGGDDIAVGVTGTVIGVGAERHADSFRIASITIEVPDTGAPVSDADPDAFTVAGDAGETALDVLANDTEITSIASVDVDLDDDEASDILGTVAVAADGLSLTYDPGTAFAELLVGETATESFTYTATGTDGEARTETVTVTIDGTYVPPATEQITFDLTGEGDDTSDLRIVQDGIALNLTAALFEGTDGEPLAFDDVGTGVFDLSGDVDITRAAEGVGANTTAGLEREQSIGGDGPDELVSINFSQDVNIISVDLVPLVDGLAGSEEGQTYRLFTDSDADGIVDTVTGNLQTGDGLGLAVNSEGTVVGFGAERSIDAFRISSITVEVVVTDGETVEDAFTVDADAGETALAVLDNDTDMVEITAVDDSGLQGSLTISEDGQSVSYDPGLAFDALETGTSVTETFTYTAVNAAGETQVEEVTVTVAGQAVYRTVVLDLTYDDGDPETIEDRTATTDDLFFSQDGIEFTVHSEHFRSRLDDEGNIVWLAFNQFGTGVFELFEYDDPTINVQRSDGLGVLNQAPVADADDGFDGWGSDEIATFTFTQEVEFVSAEFMPRPNRNNEFTDNQAFRLFTDTDDDGIVDTVSPNTIIVEGAQMPLGFTDNVIGFGAERAIDDYTIKTITVRVRDEGDVEEPGPASATDDAFNIAAADGEAALDVLGNDEQLTLITAVDTDLDDDGESDLLGTVVIAEDGTSVTYDPGAAFDDLPAGETAVETFSYDATDAEGNPFTATVSVTVAGGAASASSDDVLVLDGNATATPIPVLDNDSLITSISAVDTDLDDDGSSDLLGSVSIAADGRSVSYDPGTAFADLPIGETATETFTYDALGADGVTRTATVVVTVNGTAESAAQSDAFDVAETAGDTTLAVLDNDTLITSINSVDSADILGTVEVAADAQSLVYNPGTAFADLEAGETATETFTYSALGADGASRTETVVVTITGEANSATVTDAYTVGEDDGPTTLTVLGNDTLITSIDSVDDTGILGTIEVAADGQSLSYDPGTAFAALNDDETATETFTYDAIGEDGVTRTETVTVTVEGADEPIIEGPQTITFDLTGDLAVDDTTLTFTQAGVTLTLDAALFRGTNLTNWVPDSYTGGSGFNIINLGEAGETQQTADGAGILNDFSFYADRSNAVDGWGGDEMFLFEFDQDVTFVSADVVSVANSRNASTDNQAFRLFTDTDADGTLDTISANIATSETEEYAIGSEGSVIGFGAQREIDSFFIASITVQIDDIA